MSEALTKLCNEKERLQQHLHHDDRHEQLQVACDRWEEMVKPYLVAMKSGNLREDNPAVETLGIGDEIDRLFNFTYARSSQVRELLQAMDTKITCFFKAKQPTDKRSKGQRLHHELDKGQVSITLRGMTEPLQHEGSIPQGVSRLLSFGVRRQEVQRMSRMTLLLGIMALLGVVASGPVVSQEKAADKSELAVPFAVTVGGATLDVPHRQAPPRRTPPYTTTPTRGLATSTGTANPVSAVCA